MFSEICTSESHARQHTCTCTWRDRLSVVQGDYCVCVSIYTVTHETSFLFRQGFCLPAEYSDEVEGEGATEFADIEGGGLGEGEGVKDVSDQIETEDQVGPVHDSPHKLVNGKIFIAPFHNSGNYSGCNTVWSYVLWTVQLSIGPDSIATTVIACQYNVMECVIYNVGTLFEVVSLLSNRSLKKENIKISYFMTLSSFQDYY